MIACHSVTMGAEYLLKGPWCKANDKETEFWVPVTSTLETNTISCNGRANAVRIYTKGMNLTKTKADMGSDIQPG
jgi:hypothetical protein